MTILFGNLTTAFTNYFGLRLTGASDEVLSAASTALFREVNKDVLILVYIGIGTVRHVAPLCRDQRN